ncbi:hypothetical protein SAICODRAFT_31816 [Saitoella complicata NRRL Y-17804]|nr:uncharacterized protein SAICODRAFT_31816 [Saitoella complicata NRRL Y-17804]ODQ50509.1 hypothetical protein SAICODRAFT_31816 [Saitoella complicata NRRL Y-17804]
MRPFTRLPLRSSPIRPSTLSKTLIFNGPSAASVRHISFRDRFILESRTALKIIAFSSTAVSLIILGTYYGTHIYLESTEPTPKEFPWRARELLRSVRVGQDWMNDDARAMTWARNALEECGLPLETPNLEEEAKTKTDAFMKGWVFAVQKYAYTLGRTGQASEAVRLYELALKLAPKHLLSPEELSDIYRNLGDHQSRTPDVVSAESNLLEAYNLALNSLHPLPPNSPALVPDPKTSPNTSQQLINASLSLGLLYAKTSRLDLALPTLLSVFRAQKFLSAKSITTKGKPAQPDPHALCAEAATQTHLAEILAVLHQNDRALSFASTASTLAKRGLEIASARKDTTFCGECAGVAENVKGLLLEMDGRLEEALEAFLAATDSAEVARDMVGRRMYVGNVKRVNDVKAKAVLPL